MVRTTNPNLQIEIDETRSPLVAELRGVLDRTTVTSAYKRLGPYLSSGGALILDVGGVSQIDSAGVALFAHGFKQLGTGPTGCSLTSVGGEVARTMKLAGWDFQASTDSVHAKEPPLVEAVGEEAVAAGQGAYYFLFLLSEIFYHGLISPFKGEKPRFRIFIEQMSRLGAGSAPIVLLVALLVGLTTAFQSAYELRQFGANIYIADLVAISMMVELGPLMAAILVAGRSGAAITAELGTMQVNEEIDALKLIGINPIQYLAVPRIYAIVITQALLGISASIVGIFGGLVIAVTYLDLSTRAYIHEALDSLVIGDLYYNLTKNMVFGFIIVAVGVFYGLRVSGGAEGVGRATTNSVVTAIVMIIVADCIYSFT